MRELYDLEPIITSHGPRTEKAMRAMIQELKRRSVIERDRPIEQILENPITVHLDGQANLVAMLHSALDAWFDGDQIWRTADKAPTDQPIWMGVDWAAPEGDQAGIVELPVQTLDSIAAEGQAKAAIDKAGKQGDGN